jgi:hypothetical protein
LQIGEAKQMRAEEALRQSKNNFIESDIRNGSAVIFQESGAASECFRLFFVPRREKEVCGLSIETVEVGVRLPASVTARMNQTGNRRRKVARILLLKFLIQLPVQLGGRLLFEKGV